jgi:sarcosine oxidase subunit gamma
MSALTFHNRGRLERCGLKGPGAVQWLTERGLPVPQAPNSWAGAAHADEQTILVARLGTAEFFLEDHAQGTRLRDIRPHAPGHPQGVYPVLREDAGFLLSGAGSLDVLAQVCNVNFADPPPAARPVIMTSMIGVSVLVVAQLAPAGGADAECRRQFRIWCDPSFGAYMEESLGTVVNECGGNRGST